MVWMLLKPQYFSQLFLFSQGIFFYFITQTEENRPTMQETQVQSLVWEDVLEKGIGTHSNISAWRIPWIEEPGELQLRGLLRIEYNWATNTFTFIASKVKLNHPGVKKKWV